MAKGQSKTAAWLAEHCTPRPPINQSPQCPCSRCWLLPEEAPAQRQTSLPSSSTRSSASFDSVDDLKKSASAAHIEHAN